MAVLSVLTDSDGATVHIHADSEGLERLSQIVSRLKSRPADGQRISGSGIPSASASSKRAPRNTFSIA